MSLKKGKSFLKKASPKQKVCKSEGKAEQGSKRKREKVGERERERNESDVCREDKLQEETQPECNQTFPNY